MCKQTFTNKFKQGVVNYVLDYPDESKLIVTDEKGKATTASKEQPRGSLPFDTYIVEETKTPEGYNPIKPFEVTIKEEAVTITGIYKQDTLITSPIQVVKVDKSTGKTIPVKGATFQLLDKNKEVITMTTHYPNTQVLDRFTTDENGQFVFPEKLKYGTYYLREIQAPDGYLLNGQELPFTVTKDAGWENPIVVKFEDENAMGKIELSKFEEGFSNQLKGAVFEIRAAEDIVTPDGTIRLKKGDLADTLTTTGLNPIQSKALFLGKYILKEIKQADGFVLSDKEYPVTLKYKDRSSLERTCDLAAVSIFPFHCLCISKAFSCIVIIFHLLLIFIDFYRLVRTVNNHTIP